jgi:DNA polymerase III delta prime subunit
MTRDAQNRFLSLMDGSEIGYPNGIFIFTCNDTSGLEERFRQRCIELQFTFCTDYQKMGEWLAGIWALEMGNSEPRPDFLRMAEDSYGTVRKALLQLDQKILLSQAGCVTV